MSNPVSGAKEVLVDYIVDHARQAFPSAVQKIAGIGILTIFILGDMCLRRMNSSKLVKLAKQEISYSEAIRRLPRLAKNLLAESEGLDLSELDKLERLEEGEGKRGSFFQMKEGEKTVAIDIITPGEEGVQFKADNDSDEQLYYYCEVPAGFFHILAHFIKLRDGENYIRLGGVKNACEIIQATSHLCKAINTAKSSEDKGAVSLTIKEGDEYGYDEDENEDEKTLALTLTLTSETYGLFADEIGGFQDRGEVEAMKVDDEDDEVEVDKKEDNGYGNNNHSEDDETKVGFSGPFEDGVNELADPDMKFDQASLNSLINLFTAGTSDEIDKESILRRVKAENKTHKLFYATIGYLGVVAISGLVAFTLKSNKVDYYAGTTAKFVGIGLLGCLASRLFYGAKLDPDELAT